MGAWMLPSVISFNPVLPSIPADTTTKSPDGFLCWRNSGPGSRLAIRKGHTRPRAPACAGVRWRAQVEVVAARRAAQAGLGQGAGHGAVGTAMKADCVEGGRKSGSHLALCRPALARGAARSMDQPAREKVLRPGAAIGRYSPDSCIQVSPSRRHVPRHCEVTSAIQYEVITTQRTGDETRRAFTPPESRQFRLASRGRHTIAHNAEDRISCLCVSSSRRTSYCCWM